MFVVLFIFNLHVEQTISTQKFMKNSTSCSVAHAVLADDTISLKQFTA